MTAPDLDAIQANYDAAQKTLANDPNIVSIMQLHRLNESANDVPALLALVREQQARIERVEKVRGELFEFSKDAALTLGQCAAYRDASRAIYTALTATEGQA